MGYDAIEQAEVEIDQAIPTDLMQKIKDNFDYLFANTGTVVLSNLINNGSFETTDPATDYPEGWVVTPGSSNVVSTEDSNNHDSGLKAVQVVFNSTNACTLISEFAEISPKLFLKWALRAAYTTNSLLGVKVFKMKLSFYKGDQTASDVTPDVDGSGHPYPIDPPLNVYATAGVGYIEYDLSSTAIFPNTPWGTIPPFYLFDGMVKPPEDARFFKTTITMSIASLVTSYKYLLDGVYAIQSGINDSFSVVASDTLQMSLDTLVHGDHAEIVPTEAKRFLVYRPGTYRVKFDLNSFEIHTIPFGRIYRNGVAVGTLQTGYGTEWATYSEDFYFSPGDIISVYIWTNGENRWANCYAQVRNYRCYFTPNEPTVYGYGKDLL